MWIGLRVKLKRNKQNNIKGGYLPFFTLFKDEQNSYRYN